MRRLQQMMGGGGGAPEADAPKADTAEKIQISSLSLLKMIKHGRFKCYYNQFFDIIYNNICFCLYFL